MDSFEKFSSTDTFYPCQRKISITSFRLKKSSNFYLPLQSITPSPIQPGSQAQENDPGLFVQVASLWQLSRSSVHSLTSGNNDNFMCQIQSNIFLADIFYTH